LDKLRVVSSDLKATCAEPAARVAQAEGDFTTAVAQNKVLVSSLEEDGDNGSPAWVTATYGLATALAMSTDYRGALNTDRHILEVMKSQGLKDTATYFAIGSLGCAVMRSGGQPKAAVGFIASIVADARSTGANIDVPYFLDGCRDFSRIAAGEISDDLEASLVRNSKAIAASGMQHMVIPYQAQLAQLAMNRGDIPAAEARWAPLADLEREMLGANRSGLEVAAVLLSHAKLEICRGRYAEASRLLEQMNSKIAAHHQANTDDRLIAIFRSQIALATREYPEAIRQAEAALEISRKTAIDPHSSAYIGEALLWRAEAESAQGDRVKARASAQEALPHLEDNMNPASGLIARAQADSGLDFGSRAL
jgi:tetratricopeptide (TPR) repeat protein